jgi:photosystem II stability/assembly factor-like uncharacterized protein
MVRRIRTLPAGCALSIALLTLGGPVAGQSGSSGLTSEILNGLRARPIGPAVTGGRIHDIEALPNDPATIYVASASGGLWKTTNKGTTWTPLFQDQAVSTFGDVTIAPSNPEIVWVGTGEQNNRQSSSWGNGVYRSRDGGRSWTHLGLEETRHVGRIRVHPRNPDVAYVAALGNLWAASADRGVFKTSDGGKSWQKVLFVNDVTGVVDLAMDSSNPDTLYAAAYQRLRQPFGFNGGGPGSGIYKTIDGGRTWRQLTNGIPSGDKGRIGIALSASNPRVLSATIETGNPDTQGTYRTEDGGETWTRVNPLNPRPMYYSHIYIDPREERRVYVLGTNSYRSEDGGRKFDEIAFSPTYDVGVHRDHHALWINPGDTRHLYLGTDGGFYESWDRGETWTKIDNLTLAQFYAIGVDMREPYYVYGGLQDNHSWMVPSATRHWAGILREDWKQIGFSDGMFQQPDPTSHRYVYSNATSGSLTRVDAETGDILSIRPTPPAGESPYRFYWTTPSLVSQHDPQVVYFGGNRLFISRDRGLTWDRTDDLSRRIDRETLPIMGVVGKAIRLSRHDGVGAFSTAVTVAESPVDASILWVGFDDGNVQVSQDGGATWTEVSRNVRGLPDGTFVSRIVASNAGVGVAYATFDGHRSGDFKPYVYRTRDFGRSWEPLMNGLPSGSVNVIREHPKNTNLLFVGTEHALYVSVDAGTSWVRFTAGLPTTLYWDVVIHPRDNDLVIGTHGRGVWIVDDITPLVEWAADVTSADAKLFPLRPATIFQLWKDESYRGNSEFAGENPPFGAIVSYHLGRVVPSARITVTNRQGRTLRTLEAPASAGLHRLVWDLRHEPPPSAARESDEEAQGRAGANRAVAVNPQLMAAVAQPLDPRGPFVSPGSYNVTLEAGSVRLTKSVVVKADPQMPMLSQWDYEQRERFLLDVDALHRQAYDAAQRADALQKGDESVQSLARTLTGVRDQLNRLAGECNGNAVRQGSLYPPTTSHRQRFADLQRSLAESVKALRERETGAGVAQ